MGAEPLEEGSPVLEIRSATQDRAGGDGWRAAARTVPERRPVTEIGRAHV